MEKERGKNSTLVVLQLFANSITVIQITPGLDSPDPLFEKLAATSSYNETQTSLLKLLLKGWCYFPHFRGAEYSRKKFSKFALPSGRSVHSTSIASYKQLQDLSEELLFRLRSSIRNCPDYKGIPVWVPPEPREEPEFLAPNLIDVPEPPGVEVRLTTILLMILPCRNLCV